MRRIQALSALIAIAIAVTMLPANGNPQRPLALADSVGLSRLVDDGAPMTVASSGVNAASATRWIDRVNSYRATAGLGPVEENPTWSEGARRHSNYLVINDRTGHGENPSLPGYSAEGAAAGANGNVISATTTLTDAIAIDSWMAAPFHALGLLDPRLRQSGFGLVSAPGTPGVTSAATLDVVRGLDWNQPWPQSPVIWPGNGTSVPIGSHDGNEWPDPLASCPGFTAPSALPVIVMFPKSVATASASVSGESAVCVITSTSYRSSNAVAQQQGREILAARNAVLIIGRSPFSDGSRPSVSVHATATDGSHMSASSTFTVSTAPFGGAPVWAELQAGATGHWVLTDTGVVDATGSAPHFGDMAAYQLARPMVAMQSTPSGRGYWLVAEDGGVFTFGDAGFHGSAGAEHLRANTVALESTPSGSGYWIVTAAGEIRAFGDAGHYGDLSAYQLAAPVVDITRTPSGRGYWLVAEDGGVFTFGDAGFHGSAGAISLAQPVVALERTATGRGYWLIALDGGVFTYGDARFFGSGGATHLNAAVRAITRSPGGNGYWLLTERGQILAFGDASPR